MGQIGGVRVAVVNAGSSSLKLRVLDRDFSVLARADVDGVPGDDLAQVLEEFLGSAPEVEAAGHRVVHGGAAFTEPVLLDRGAEEVLSALVDLAPLHNPPSLAAIRALTRIRPDVPQVACFDTAFHAQLPPAAATYALPRPWREQFGVRRFGFHGLSHAWASSRGASLLGSDRRRLRMVTAHIGAGASLCAVERGRSVDTTMGFTPLEGLVMATRSGSVDPGLVLWLQRHAGISASQMEEALEHGSGLTGLCGTGDLREVQAARADGSPEAALAYEVYLHRLRGSVAAMAAAMGGIDALVFTGGAGEGSAELRRDVCQGLEFLGVRIHDDANRAAAGDAVISPPDSPVGVAVVEAREDVEIARQVREVVATG